MPKDEKKLLVAERMKITKFELHGKNSLQVVQIKMFYKLPVIRQYIVAGIELMQESVDMIKINLKYLLTFINLLQKLDKRNGSEVLQIDLDKLLKEYRVYCYTKPTAERRGLKNV